MLELTRRTLDGLRFSTTTSFSTQDCPQLSFATRSDPFVRSWNSLRQKSVLERKNGWILLKL